jgi:transposase
MRLCEIVGLVGYALGGLPGERLLNRLGIKSSDDTVLRRVKARRRGAIQPAVRVLSVDDWAWRKKQRYGTMLMDLERSQVIDLLPERSADSFARWLGLHPEVEVIARDRSSLYADGGRQALPPPFKLQIATTWSPISVRRWNAMSSNCRSTRASSWLKARSGNRAQLIN